jgi:PIN domain nuclease of toxin-antitoxin system
LLFDRRNEVYLSAASGWEIAIQRQLGRLKLPTGTVAFLADALTAYSIVALPITLEHAIRAGELPLHHKDPFDRLLIAQAEIENLTLATPDRAMAPYGVSTLW